MSKSKLSILILIFTALFFICSCSGSGSTNTNPPSTQSANTPTDEEPVSTPEPESDADTFNNPAVPKAAHQASAIFLVSNPSFPESLTLTTLQGIVCNLGSEQILLRARGWEFYSDYMVSNYNATLSSRNENDQSWNTWRLVTHFKDKISGYILCDNTIGSVSQNIAVSISGQLNAIVVTQSQEQRAKDQGLELLADTRSMTDEEFKSSPYFQKINKDAAVQQIPSLFTVLTDYAAMSSSYINFYNGKNPSEHKSMFNFLNPGALIVGWNGVLGEYDTINSYSDLNLSLIPADHAPNLSTLSGFRLESAKQKTKEVSSAPTESKHTVTLLMSDGDNVQWFLDDYARSRNHFNSSLRGTFDMGWGLPPAAIDMAAPMLNYFYDKMTPNDNFVAALSGLGYTFPSKWKDKDALETMASQMNDYMKRMDVNILNILDDLKTTRNFENCAEIYAPFTKQDDIDAILYIDFGNYRQFEGKMVWSNNKPIISARYRLWNNIPDGQISSIAENINKASKDPKNADSYSFIIVHAWSGLGGNNRLTEGGNTMNAVKALIDEFGPDVDVVTPAEFVNRIVTNLKP